MDAARTPPAMRRKPPQRPLAIVAPRGQGALRPAQLRRFLTGKVARFWIPEYWCITDQIAKTSVGKMDKRLLREKNRCGALSVERSTSDGDENGGM